MDFQHFSGAFEVRTTRVSKIAVINGVIGLFIDTFNPNVKNVADDHKRSFPTNKGLDGGLSKSSFKWV